MSVPNPLARSLLRWFGHQHWLRFGVRDRFIRAMHNPEESSSLPFRCFFYGGGIYNGNLCSFIDWSVYYFGAYSCEELDLLADLLEPIFNPVVLDIGANVGNHTLFLAQRASHVLAFEPFPEFVTALELQLESNHIANVTIIPCGLANIDAYIPYFPPASSNRGVGAFVKKQPIAAEDLCLPVRQGDQLLNELGIASVQLIKIDTEGFEVEVLKGLQHTLNQHRPIVFFEWSQPARGKSPLATGAGMFPTGYRFSRVLPPRHRFGLITRGRYQLEPLTSLAPWPVGNILACPV